MPVLRQIREIGLTHRVLALPGAFSGWTARGQTETRLSEGEVPALGAAGQEQSSQFLGM